MYPYDHLPKPLKTHEFYVLLALSREEAHAYRLKSRIANDSLGSVKITEGTLYPLLQKLHDEGLIDLLGEKPAGKSRKSRLHYGISPGGVIRLKEELKRLDHAIEIGKNAALMTENELPTDIQRTLLELEIRT
jgi:DNA-binding PadR family transcriptional regulator